MLIGGIYMEFTVPKIEEYEEVNKHHHRADPAHPGGPDQGDRPLPGTDRPALRREPDDPARDHTAALRRVPAGDRGVGREDRGDRRRQPQRTPAGVP